MRKILSILLTLGILVGLVLPLAVSQPVYAAKGEQPKKVEQEELQPGEVRLSSHMKVKRIGGDATTGRYEGIISMLPQTLPDLKTKITTEWRIGTSDDGISYLVTGNNIFYAKVTGNRVSAEYQGKLARWDPTVIVAGKTLPLVEGPTVVDDPFNSNYKGNTIKWVYAGDIGTFLFKRDYKVTRYLRQIEGLLYEVYRLEYDPRGDVEIISGYKAEGGFLWIRPIFAFDAKYKEVPITQTKSGKLVKASDLIPKNATYPVYIDDTLDFETTSDDGHLQRYNASYSTARTASTAEFFSSSTPSINVGQRFSTDYFITRVVLFFDTSTVPDGATISASALYFRGSNVDYNQTYFNIVVQNGMPTYPHAPLVAGDYYYLNYGSNGGQLYTSGFSTDSYNLLNLDSTGVTWVNKTGYTKFILRSDKDINGTTPTGYEWVGIQAKEWGAGYAPEMRVVYSLPIVRPTIETLATFNIVDTYATLYGRVVDDGGAPVSVSFKYGLSTSYGMTTPPVSGYVTGQTFSTTVYGLSKGTLYHDTAVATNSAGASIDDNETFLTQPGVPTNFVATPGNLQNALSWTLGAGSSKTMVRFSTASYPTSPTSGTQVYFGTGASTTHSGLTNGTPYYYSAWGYAESGTFTQYSLSPAQVSGTPYTTGPPAVTTYAATNVAQTTATLNGRLDGMGGYSSVDVWFQYYWGTGTWTDHETTPETKTVPTTVSANIASLPAATLIHQRIAATSTGGTTYGTDITFTTGAISAPTMTTQAATGVTKTGATLHGKVTSDGGAVVTAWFQYGKTIAYGSDTATASGLFTGDSIYASLQDLEISTTYNFRIVGQNSAGIGYGINMQFPTTAPAAPTVTTEAATNVGATSATLRGTLTSDGGVSSEVRFQYGTTTSYGTDTGWQTNKVSGQSFEQHISGLTIGQTYNFRAQAKNLTATVNGTDQTFITVFGAPTNFTAEPLGADSISLRWTNIGDQTGVFMKVGSFPVDRLDVTQVYFGNAQSYTVGGLNKGTTYFFRAWSWKTGNGWSTEYADAAATTGAVTTAVTPGKQDITGLPPTEPPQWWQDPTPTALSTWPFYDIVNDVATKIGMPPASLWLVLTLVLISVGALITFMISGSVMVVIVAGAVLIAMTSIMGLIPMWILLIYVVVGGGIAYLVKVT